MVSVCTEYLRGKVAAALGKDALGQDPQVFDVLKELEKCMAPSSGVLIRSDTLEYSGQPVRNLDTGINDLKVFDRTVVIDIVLGAPTKAELDASFETFLLSLERGIRYKGHYIGISLGEGEWVDRKDSVIKAEIAVELPVTFTGGVYKPKTYTQIADITLER